MVAGGMEELACDHCGARAVQPVGGGPDTLSWLKSPEGDLCGVCVAYGRALLAGEPVGEDPRARHEREMEPYRAAMRAQVAALAAGVAARR